MLNAGLDETQLKSRLLGEISISSNGIYITLTITCIPLSINVAKYLPMGSLLIVVSCSELSCHTFYPVIYWICGLIFVFE